MKLEARIEAARKRCQEKSEAGGLVEFFPPLRDVLRIFECEIADEYVEGLIPVCVYNSIPDYEEEIIVLFVRDGKLLAVEDSHCSCHGFENFDLEDFHIVEINRRNFYLSVEVDREPVRQAIHLAAREGLALFQ